MRLYISEQMTKDQTGSPFACSPHNTPGTLGDNCFSPTVAAGQLWVRSVNGAGGELTECNVKQERFMISAVTGCQAY